MIKTVHDFFIIYLFSPDMCGGVLKGLSGVISSPGYPQEYSNNADCSWTIHVSNTSVVSLVFIDFQLENNEGCNFDFVALFDGPTVTHRHLGNYCGADRPPNIVTTSNQLLVVFKSDFNIGGRGFKAHYYSGTWMEFMIKNLHRNKVLFVCHARTNTWPFIYLKIIILSLYRINKRSTQKNVKRAKLL